MLANEAKMQTAKKIQNEMLSGFNSAIKGVIIVAALQNVLQIPNVVAAIPTGNSCVLAMKTVLKPEAIPILAVKMKMQRRIWFVVWVTTKANMPQAPIAKANMSTILMEKK